MRKLIMSVLCMSVICFIACKSTDRSDSSLEEIQTATFTSLMNISCNNEHECDIKYLIDFETSKYDIEEKIKYINKCLSNLDNDFRFHYLKGFRDLIFCHAVLGILWTVHNIVSHGKHTAGVITAAHKPGKLPAYDTLKKLNMSKVI